MHEWLATGLLAAAWLVSACGASDSAVAIEDFCRVLAEVNGGSVDTSGLAELQGHALVARTLLEQAPPSLVADLTRIHETVDAWARAVSGDHPMLDTFDKLSAPELIGSEGRVTDFAAEHCGIDLGGPQWVEAERPTAEDLCPAWPRIGTPLTFNHFPNLPDIAGSNYFAQNFLISDAASTAGLKTLKGAFVVERGGKAVFRGQYPKTRYFAYHPNDMDLNNLKTLRDRDLEPDPGSVNPFREVAPAGSENSYTATLVFGPPPAEPEPNTSYVGLRKDGVTENGIPAEPAAHVPHRCRQRDRLRRGAAAGTQHLRRCGRTRPALRGVRDVRPRRPRGSNRAGLPVPANHRPPTAKNPPQWTTSSNFDAPSDTLANADVQYLVTHYSERFGDIFVTRAKYLTAPDTRGGESPAARRASRCACTTCAPTTSGTAGPPSACWKTSCRATRRASTP